MIVLTPAERRVALLLVGLLALGAVTDRAGGRLGAPASRADTSWAAAPVAAPRGAAPPPAMSGAVAVPGEPMDLNHASARELDALPGVGPVLAARIIEHRVRYGAFRSTTDLRAVRGIGPRLFERLEPLVRVGDAAPRSRLGSGAGDSASAVRTAP